MGYAIRIGELEVTKEPEDGLDCSCISFDVKPEVDDGSPAFGDPTDYTNSRWPSYSAWSETMQDVGLYSTFFLDGHLIGGHPGVRLVTPELVAVVAEALRSYKAKNPNAKPEYGTTEGASLCRLIWLDYWLSKSIDTCEVPVIVNS